MRFTVFGGFRSALLVIGVEDRFSWIAAWTCPIALPMSCAHCFVRLITFVLLTCQVTPTPSALVHVLQRACAPHATRRSAVEPLPVTAVVFCGRSAFVGTGVENSTGLVAVRFRAQAATLCARLEHL